MKWLRQAIRKKPKLKKKIRRIIEITKKGYMFLVNRIVGVNDKKIVFISFNGKSYSDNPRAISERLHEIYPLCEIVWLFISPKEKNKIVPDYVRCVAANSFYALNELATAKLWVDNFLKPIHVYKSKSQVYVQTWHGDRGFKKILYDCRELLPNGHYKEGDLLEEKHCDLAIAGSEYGKMQYRSAFKYKGEILESGCPRNDKLLKKNEYLVNEIKKSLQIDGDAKIILYAPTFRLAAYNKKVVQDISEINLVEVLNTLDRKTNEKWICLVRAHSVVDGLSGMPDDKRFLNVSDYEDMSDLLIISDLLITDYSSSGGDFALLEKPVIFFQHDRELYLEKDRAFYFDISETPFMVAVNQTDLIGIIEKIDACMISQNCKDILAFYGTNETGKSAEAIVNYMISKMEGAK